MNENIHQLTHAERLRREIKRLEAKRDCTPYERESLRQYRAKLAEVTDGR